MEQHLIEAWMTGLEVEALLITGFMFQGVTAVKVRDASYISGPLASLTSSCVPCVAC